MDKVSARKRLVKAICPITAEQREVLEKLTEAKSDLERADFVWHALLHSFATMGRASGWERLQSNPSSYQHLTYPALSSLSSEERRERIREVFRQAGIRMHNKKAGWLIGCFNLLKQLGGPEEAKSKLLSQKGREAKISFLKQFPGIGKKYARNIMMDVYHEDFRDSIAIDNRIIGISVALGLMFSPNEYEEHESFYLDVARDARINGWELDRLLFNFYKDVKSIL